MLVPLTYFKESAMNSEIITLIWIAFIILWVAGVHVVCLRFMFDWEHRAQRRMRWSDFFNIMCGEVDPQ
jgi:hypothetical protein